MVPTTTETKQTELYKQTNGEKANASGRVHTGKWKDGVHTGHCAGTHADAGHGAEASTGTKVATAEQNRLVSAGCQTSIAASLQASGYEGYGMCFIHEQEPRCEVEFEFEFTDDVNAAAAPAAAAAAAQTVLITVTAAGLGEDELARFVAMELAANRPDEFGVQVLEGVKNMLHMSGAGADALAGACADAGADAAAVGNAAASDDLLTRAVEKMPSVDDVYAHPCWVDCKLSVKSDRRLHIYTWGDALMKKTALKSRKSQFDINAKPLNGRGGGANTKHNALQDQRIMLNVAASLADARGMQLLVQTLRKIEGEDLSTISVFCTKGRHRSVSLAVLLQHRYYPNAIVEHLTIK